MPESFNPTLQDAPQLPAEVLAALLERVPEITAQVRAVIGPVAQRREELRAKLRERNWIEPIAEPEPKTVAAVDGAPVTDPLYAGDFVVALAVAAEGLTPAGLLDRSCLDHKIWAQFLNHDFDQDRLAKAAMAAQELLLLTQLTHDVCIFDGSHQTPVIIFNAALASKSSEVRARTIEVCEAFDVPTHLQALCDPDAGARIVGCPKSDSSRDLARFLEAAFNVRLPTTDKVIASLVLQPGEMIKAIKAPPSWAQLHIMAERTDDQAAKAMARKLDRAIRPLREQTIRIAYAKPASCSTAVKIELKEHLGPDWRRSVAGIVAAETPGPHLQEPFCQHLADLWAKSASLGAQAQLHSVRLDLTEGQDVDYLEYLLRSYRSYGG